MRGSGSRWAVAAALGGCRDARGFFPGLGAGRHGDADRNSQRLAGRGRAGRDRHRPASGAGSSRKACQVSRASTVPRVGPWHVQREFELQGFKTYMRDQVALQVDTTTQVDAVMSVGDLTQTVTVTEATPIINVSDASLGNVMTQLQIQQLPLEARNPVSLLSLQTGAVYLPTGISAAARSAARAATNRTSRSTASTSTTRSGATPTTRCSGSRRNRCRSSGSAPATTRPTWDDRAPRRYRSSPRAARTSSTAPATGRTATPTGRATNIPEALATRAGTAEPGPKARQTQLRRRPRRPDQEGPVLLLRQLRGAERVERKSPVLRNVPSPTLRDGVLVYVCAEASQCPGGTVQGFSSSHSIPAGRYGLTPAEIARLDPLAIGPSRAVSDHFKKYPMPNDPGRDGINYMGYRSRRRWRTSSRPSRPVSTHASTMAGNHKVFFRGVKQDDVIDSTPSFPGQATGTVREQQLGLRDRPRRGGVAKPREHVPIRVDEDRRGDARAAGRRRGDLPIHHRPRRAELDDTRAKFPLTTSSTISPG